MGRLFLYFPTARGGKRRHDMAVVIASSTSHTFTDKDSLWRGHLYIYMKSRVVHNWSIWHVCTGVRVTFKGQYSIASFCLQLLKAQEGALYVTIHHKRLGTADSDKHNTKAIRLLNINLFKDILKIRHIIYDMIWYDRLYYVSQHPCYIAITHSKWIDSCGYDLSIKCQRFPWDAYEGLHQINRNVLLLCTGQQAHSTLFEKQT